MTMLTRSWSNFNSEQNQPPTGTHDVDTTAKDVGSDEDALFKVLELLIALDALVL
jgi:hypothetical protein